MSKIDRPIKFRAWQDGEMLTQPTPGVYAMGRLLGLLYEDTDLMQYTGHKDKNGVEIYEGDILATSNSNPEYDIWEKEDNGTTTVFYDEDLCCFRGDNWGWDYHMEPCESIYHLNFVEVVGNIFEGVKK